MSGDGREKGGGLETYSFIEVERTNDFVVVGVWESVDLRLIQGPFWTCAGSILDQRDDIDAWVAVGV